MAYNTSSSLLGFVADAVGVKPNNEAPVASQDRPKDTDWLNIGITLPNLQDENGNPVFVSLPLGVAIDRLTVKDVKGTGVVADTYRARNALLSYLQETFRNLPEGTRCIIPELKVEAYKARTVTDVQATVDVANGISSVFGASPADLAAKMVKKDQCLKGTSLGLIPIYRDKPFIFSEEILNGNFIGSY